jgi:thiosulfate dehydrogenase
LTERKIILFSTILVVVLVVAAAGLLLFFGGLTRSSRPWPEATIVKGRGALGPAEVVFNPPAPEAAPASIRNAVMLGYNILMNTQKYAPQYVGNKLNCRNCHFEAGRERNTLSLVGVAASYPKYRTRQHYATDLVTRTQGCFQRSMNGKPLPPEGRLMQAIMAYYHWISRGIPIYARVPWLGLKKLKSDHRPDRAAGQKVYAAICARCHGDDGQGTDIAPPLWGPHSFNDGAGMHQVKNLSAFAHWYMPKGNPVLTVVQALDVAGFIAGRPRPHFGPR